MKACLVVALLCLSSSLAGCATDRVTFHRLPNETPAADNAAAMRKAADLDAAKAAAAKQQQASGGDVAPPLTPADAPALVTYDPWERLNRFTYRFNARFDEAIFFPVANGYRRLPNPVQGGLHNFFDNLTEIDSIINYTLQWRLKRGVRSLGRFVINSTLGLAGLFDVAQKLNIDYAPTGFGTTLSQWGMHPGPYLVIPLLGPSTLREAVGLLGDYGTSYGINFADLYRSYQSYGLGVTDAVDTRAHVDFRYYSTGSAFEYDYIRFLYVRKLLLEDEGLHRNDTPKRPKPGVPAGE